MDKKKRVTKLAQYAASLGMTEKEALIYAIKKGNTYREVMLQVGWIYENSVRAAMRKHGVTLYRERTKTIIDGG